MYGYLYNIEDGVVKQDSLAQQELEIFIQLGSAPIVQIDYEQQPLTPLQQFQISHDNVDTLVVWPIPPGAYVVPALMASSLHISKRQRYWMSKAAMMELSGIEQPQYSLGVTINLDNSYDNQIPQLPYQSDRDVIDTTVERITIPTMEWDTDADQQKLSPVSFNADTLADEEVELITLPAIVATFTWDDVSENSKQQANYFKDHLSDECVELITISPAIKDFTWDSGAEYQLLQPGLAINYWDGREVLPAIATIFVQGFGSATIVQIALGVEIEYIVKGAIVSTTTSKGQISPPEASGLIQPLIDVDGKLLP